MSKRKYREAAQAKRRIPPPLTEAQTLAIDRAYNAYKNNPSIREHKMHQDEVRMSGRAG